MQLIHNTQPTAERNINMSTQAESPINCDINEIKRIMNADKENNPIIDEETISASANIETETSKHAKIKEDNIHEDIINGCDSNEILNKVDKLENINNVSLDYKTNGSSDVKDNQLDDTILETAPQIALETLNVEVNVKLQKIESSDDETQVKLDAEVKNNLPENGHEISDTNDTNFVNETINVKNISIHEDTKDDTASPTVEKLSSNNELSESVLIEDNVKSSEVLTNLEAIVENVTSSSIDLPDLVSTNSNTTLSSSSQVLSESLDEVKINSLEVPDNLADTMITDKTNNSNTVEENTTLSTVDNLPAKHIIKDEEVISLDETPLEATTDIKTNNETNSSITVTTKDPANEEIIIVNNTCSSNDEEELSFTSSTSLTDETVQNKEKILEPSNTNDHISITDVDVVMDEIPDISNADKTDCIENLDNEVLEDVNTAKVNNESVKSCNEEGVVNDKKEIEDDSMDVDDIEIIDLEKEKLDKPANEDNCEKDTVEAVLPAIDNENSIIPILEDAELNNKASELPTDKTDHQPEKSPEIDDQDKVEIIDEDEITVVEKTSEELTGTHDIKTSESTESKTLPVVCKLSNTLDILSDDEEETSKIEPEKSDEPQEKQCIDIDDDDDIMLIEDDSNVKEADTVQAPVNENTTESLHEKRDTSPANINSNIDSKTIQKETTTTEMNNFELPLVKDKEPLLENSLNSEIKSTEKTPETEIKSAENLKTIETEKPLLARNFLKTAKKNLAEMTRDELEEFCILRIVEGIVDRSNLSDIKTRMKVMAQSLEDNRKRAMMLTKQNRDLQVVLKSVQEEQKKKTNVPIQPLKITRSVGMQVLMNDKLDSRKKVIITGPPPIATNRKLPQPPVQNVKPAKPPASPVNIPVPRKVPVSSSPAKTFTNTPPNNMPKITSPNLNGIRNPSPVQKVPEKRTHSRMQSTSSVTVDLTDDEPPAKVNNVPPVRVVPPQNLMAQRFTQPLNSPRKVYIPISGPPNQNIRPGQSLVVKGPHMPGTRQRMPVMQQNPIRMQKQITQRHPAPLPDALKQYTPSSWKGLPPAPDLKLSKVENGIVISWKIDGYPESGYETIASYQLYAYQETTAPPCTALWKKIGDVKALPLPMACTLTQFMAGFKYYFAVRAVDIRSRLGPFSLPGSILLLNKV